MHAQNKSYEIDMTHGPLTGKIILFTLPLVFSGLLQLFFNAADIIVVGQFASAHAVAAISSTSSLINMLIGLFLGIGVGVNVLVAHFFATHKDRDVSETVHTAICASLIAGIFLTFVGILFARPLLVAMDSPDDVIDKSVLYLRIYFSSMTANIIYNTGSAILRAVGDTKRPLFILTISGIINVLLNLLTVIYFHMDVAGVGLATSASLFVSAALVLRCLLFTEASYRFDPKKLRITPAKLKQILQIGLPAGLQSVVFSVSNVLIQSSVNSFGSMAMAGNGAAANIEGFVYIAMDAFYHACMTFTSQNYGVLDMKRVRKVAVICQVMVIITGLTLGGLAFFFAKPLLAIYVSDATAISTGVMRISIICTLYFICGSMCVLCGTLRGLGSAVIPMITSLVGACAVRILWIFTVFQIPAYHSLKTLYISYPISWGLTALAHLIYYFFLRKKIRLQIAALREKRTEAEPPPLKPKI